MCAIRTSLALLLTGCVLTAAPPAGNQLNAALLDLATAGFEFDADVRFMPDAYAVCNGLFCADLIMYKERRTIILAREAFDSRSRLRASLLEIWERYQEWRPGSVPDLARAALRVIQDGERVGVSDVYIRRHAHHRYRQLYEKLSAAEREPLTDPDSLIFP